MVKNRYLDFAKVHFSVKLAVFQADGDAQMWFQGDHTIILKLFFPSDLSSDKSICHGGLIYLVSKPNDYNQT
jgi:hypothetical protein